METDEQRTKRLARQKRYQSSAKGRETSRLYSAKWRAENPEKARQSLVNFQSTDEFREWRRDDRLKKRFGISAVEYDAMLKAQNGLCAVCKNPPSGRSPRGGKPILAVDHCHVTKRVRGLLCGQCNMALGLLKESQERIFALASYVARPMDILCLEEKEKGN